jgi:hypothetical protein
MEDGTPAPSPCQGEGWGGVVQGAKAVENWSLFSALVLPRSNVYPNVPSWFAKKGYAAVYSREGSLIGFLAICLILT